MQRLHDILVGQGVITFALLAYCAYLINGIAKKHGVKFDIFVRICKNGKDSET